MDYINPYFKDLIFSRIEEKQGFVIYGAMVEGMLANGSRYILAFVPSHLAIKTRAKIFELAWQNIQTRTLKNAYKMRQQHFQIKRGLPDVQLTVVKRENDYSTYRGPEHFPFEVLMKHDPRKKTKYQYHNHLMLSSAIESFNAIINYIGDIAPLTYTKDQEVDDSFEILA